MGLDVYLVSDIRQSIIAALVLAVETAQANGCANVQYLAGDVGACGRDRIRVPEPPSRALGQALLGALALPYFSTKGRCAQ